MATKGKKINLEGCYHILMTEARACVNGPKSCGRPVVSLSHVRKSYCVNHPYDSSIRWQHFH